MEVCIPAFLRWIEECNSGTAAARERLPLTIGSVVVGYLQPELAAELARFPDVFLLLQQQQMHQNQHQHQQEQQPVPSACGHQALALSPALSTPEQRTEAVARVLGTLRDEGRMGQWVGELYPVVTSFHEKPVFLIERAAATLFGIKAYGVHVNGYVTLPDGGQEMWLARRSRDRPTWPAKLDQMVAGGQPHGIGCAENVVKECEEEASIPPELARKAKAVGAVSYTSLKLGGLGRDVMFCYDLELPPDFVPRPQDGEVEEFVRLPVTEVAFLLVASPPKEAFKTNCNLVVIDFLLRHGYLTPDMPGYLQLLAGLRAGDCS